MRVVSESGIAFGSPGRLRRVDASWPDSWSLDIVIEAAQAGRRKCGQQLFDQLFDFGFELVVVLSSPRPLRTGVDLLHFSVASNEHRRRIRDDFSDVGEGGR